MLQALFGPFRTPSHRTPTSDPEKKTTSEGQEVVTQVMAANMKLNHLFGGITEETAKASVRWGLLYRQWKIGVQHT